MAATQLIDDDITVTRDDADLLVTWDSSEPDGTFFQVYLDRHLVWHGTQRHTSIPWPTNYSGLSWIDVCFVGDGEETTSFVDDLDALPGAGDRATLTWTGGSFEGEDLVAFRIYQSPIAGDPVDLVTPVATITAYPQDIASDGFGMGGFGMGGFGFASASYTWTSESLAGGDWDFSIAPVDDAGNEGSHATTSVTIDAPPQPPAASSGSRMFYTLDVIGATPLHLYWLASPG